MTKRKVCNYNDESRSVDPIQRYLIPRRGRRGSAAATPLTAACGVYLYKLNNHIYNIGNFFVEKPDSCF